MQADALVLSDNRISEAPAKRGPGRRNAETVKGRTVQARMRPIRVVIAGGGTGGHLFPGIAIAEEVLSRNDQSDVLFIGTGNTFEQSVLGQKGFKLAAIAIQGLKNRGIVNQVKALMMLPASLVASGSILKAFGPDLVLGVGGYSAGPVVAAAWLKGIKTALQEQNILPGITNRWLSRITDRLYLSFTGTRGMEHAGRALVTGNPVRQEFLTVMPSRQQASEAAPKATAPFTVLIAGGSQGAHAINQAMQSAMEHLSESGRFHFIHQTGADDEEMMKASYANSNAGNTVKAFFKDMARQYQTADLVVCRAGATTVAEVTALGKPVIFIPFPYAADDHQRLNAESLVREGASEMILEQELNGKMLAQRIEYYAGAPEELARMGARAARLGRPHAARAIVDDMYQLISS
ncbi:MAG: undecaprenyldiphospho-muramoylpentapeptide beta-N-acetylglucosaminyltransferase [Thermodesulfobacteriota bacterium]